MPKNECLTCFCIRGDFDPEAVCASLGLLPGRIARKGALRPDGRPLPCTMLELGRVEDYDPYTANMMEQTLNPLWDKTEALNRLRQETGVTLTLEVVPRLHTGEITPCLAPSLRVMDFCHATRTELDIDLYVEEGDDSAR